MPSLHNLTVALSTVVLVLLASACGGDSAGGGTGSVSISLEAEETITDGLDPGSDLDNVQDGWSVRYRRVLFTVGDVLAKSSDSASELREKKFYLLDLTALPQAGFVLLDADDADAVRYDQVSFSNPVAKASFVRGPAVSADDLALMVDRGWSIYVEGEIDNPEGESCTPGHPDDCKPAKRVRFAWGADAATHYEHCGPTEGDLGFAVASGGTTSHNFTIHGDHWFFNAFPEGAEIVQRQAQWVANADLDRDGETTIEELQNTLAADAFPSAKYSLSGSPIPIRSAYDFLIAQSHTIGHFDGEGECEGLVR